MTTLWIAFGMANFLLQPAAGQRVALPVAEPNPRTLAWTVYTTAK